MLPKNASQHILFHSIVAMLVTVVIYFILSRRRISELKGLAQGLSVDTSTELAIEKGLITSVRAPSLNYNVTVSSTAVNALGEIAAVQLLINWYNGEKFTEVTGVWNTETEAAIKELTGGRITSTLYEVMHILLPGAGLGHTVAGAQSIIKQITP